MIVRLQVYNFLDLPFCFWSFFKMDNDTPSFFFIFAYVAYHEIWTFFIFGGGPFSRFFKWFLKYVRMIFLWILLCLPVFLLFFLVFLLFFPVFFYIFSGLAGSHSGGPINPFKGVNRGAPTSGRSLPTVPTDYGFFLVKQNPFEFIRF